MKKGGLAQYFVEHREVGWLMLIGVLIWGAVAFTLLPQQEDPTIPHRQAQLVTRFPGGTALQVEQLVTEALQKRVAELDFIEEIKSESRPGVSILHLEQRPARAQKIKQGWDEVRARIAEVKLPAGSEAPWLNTDFGNTVTLLLALSSQPASEAEQEARARLIRSRIAEVRSRHPDTNRATVFAFFPPSVAFSYRQTIVERFREYMNTRQFGTDAELMEGQSFILADFTTTHTKEEISTLINHFARSVGGSDDEVHPDFSRPVILVGDEDPLPGIRQTVMPRFSYRELLDWTERLEDDLKQLPDVGRTKIHGKVQETVYLLYSLASIAGNNLAAERVINAIAYRNAIMPGGTMHVEGQSLPVQLTGEFADESEMLGAVVGLTKERMPVYLRDAFEVRRGYQNPVPFSISVLKRLAPGAPLQPQRSILLGVEMREGSQIGQFDAAVTKLLRHFQEQLPDGLEVLTISDQPKAVEQRLALFERSFVEAVIIVILIALLLMDWRSALVVACAIPLTVAMTLAGMHALGIPLHQISIAALIIALGMLVDDPVVASDAINRELYHGERPGVAAWLGPVKLAHAILFGTIINIVAFLPLVLLPGDKGAFIIALPLVVTLALVSSRIVSMTFIPLLAFYLLRGQRGLEEGGEIRTFWLFRPVDLLLNRLLPRYRQLLESALGRPFRTVFIAYGLLGLSLVLIPLLGRQFFPPAERNQFLIDLSLPESSSIFQTRQAMGELARVLEKHPEVESAALFLGGTAPRFYYNVVPREPATYQAQALVNTRHADQVVPLIRRLREELNPGIAGARIVVKQLEQGPAVDAPIQIRITGPDLDTLRSKADEVAAALRNAGGYTVHDDLGRRVPTLEVNIDQDRANALGVNNLRIGQVMQSAFGGVWVTDLREGDRLIPVMIRLRTEERNEVEKMRSLYVESALGSPVPLDSFATIRIKPEFANISHYELLRTVTVKSYAPVGVLPSTILRRAAPEIRELDLPPDYKLEFAGEARELRESQSEMSVVMRLSLALIAVAMVLQFKSVMKSMVVMLTVPLGLIGALLGLALTGSSIGFMSLLGIVSLAGVVVSHIIVLSDFIEEARRQGLPLRTALVQSGLVRLRAVLVTVLATVGGLIPLSVSGGQLWLPLTSVHIFGLLSATLLTLVLLPVLYLIFAEKLRWIR